MVFVKALISNYKLIALLMSLSVSLLPLISLRLQNDFLQLIHTAEQWQQEAPVPSFVDTEHGSYRHPDSAGVKASTCSNEDIQKISNMLGKPTLRNAKQISDYTKCPDNSWIRMYYKDKLSRLDQDVSKTQQANENYSFLGLNIGCNKGYDAIDMARMGTGNLKYDKDDWAKSLNTFGLKGAGACGQMNTSEEEFKLENEGNIYPGEIHCVEPLPSTARALKNSSQMMDLEKEGFVVTQATISSSNGFIRFPDLPPGNERGGLDTCEDQTTECSDVHMYTLDRYVEINVKNQGPINMLLIDVEGFDFDVIFGAGSVLDRTEYLEFEYHQKGTWKNYHITDAVRLLDGKGFTCYWAGVKKLWRITNCYIDDLYAWHGWSNVACVHRSQVELADIMENIFYETIGNVTES